jgi:hypothetical protein
MSDIRKRTGAKGTTYQVRYPSKSSPSGYAYKTFETRKEALAFREDAASGTVRTSSRDTAGNTTYTLLPPRTSSSSVRG